MRLRSMKAPRNRIRVCSWSVSKPSSRGVAEPESVDQPPKGYDSVAPLLEGFCFPAPSGRVSFMPFAGEPKSAEIQALSDRLTTWSSMRANEYLLSLTGWIGQKRERGGLMGIAN